MLHTANWCVNWVSVVAWRGNKHATSTNRVGDNMGVFFTLVWPARCWLSGFESLLVPWRLDSMVGWQKPSAMPSPEGGCLLLLHKDLAASWSSDGTGRLAWIRTGPLPEGQMSGWSSGRSSAPDSNPSGLVSILTLTSATVFCLPWRCWVMFSMVLIANSTGTHRQAAQLELRKRPKEMAHMLPYIGNTVSGWTSNPKKHKSYYRALN